MIIEAKDVKVPTINDIMGFENISKAVACGTKRTYKDAITQEVEYCSASNCGQLMTATRVDSRARNRQVIGLN